MTTHHILVVEDHEVVRQGLRWAFEDSADIAVAAEASTAAEGIALLRHRAYDGLLLDLSLPDRCGIEVLQFARLAHPKLPVLVYSMHPASEYEAVVLKAGARGYIMKDRPVEEMVAAMRTVLRGEPYVDRSADASAYAEVPTTRRHVRLSTREFEVFHKLAAGDIPSKIARDLSRSIKTVSTHRANILRKMGMRTNSELTYYAMKHRLIE